MPTRIFLTGSTGFVGSAVLDELLKRGFAVNALVNHRKPGRTHEQLTVFNGSLSDSSSLNAALAGCDAAVHLVGIIQESPAKGVTFQSVHVEGTRAVVEALKRAGVRRYVHMSALGTRPNAASRYHQTKFAAEQIVQASGLDWTIFRPSLIHGPHGDFTKMETAWAHGKAAPFVFMPYFGAGVLGTGGAGLLQPVLVTDVARAFVDALTLDQTIGKIYDVAGPDRVTWKQMHQTFARAVVGHKRLVAPIPTWYAKLLTRIVPGSLLPFSRDQVVMSQEDNTGDIAPLKADFGWTPQAFESAVASYAARE